MTREELEEGRHRGHKTYGYFWSFCEQQRCCEDCDKRIRFGCKVKRKIEDIQINRILKICKSGADMRGERYGNIYIEYE